MYPIRVLCKVMEVSTSGFYDHVRRALIITPAKTKRGHGLIDKNLVKPEICWKVSEVDPLGGRSYDQRRKVYRYCVP